MAYWNRQEEYVQDKAVIAFVDGQCSPYSVTLEASDLGYTTSSQKKVPAGHFVSATGGNPRFLARSNVQTGGAGTEVVADQAYLFKVGDAVVIYTLTDRTSLDAGFTGLHSTTITAIDYVTGTLTLAAAAPAVTAGIHGIGEVPDEVYGVYPHSVDFTKAPAVTVGVIDKAGGVYRNALPYYDSAIEASFGRLLNVRVKF